jgi:putative phage-type endonuclease
MIQGTNEWLEWRKKGAGASEVAAIIGVNPYTTCRQVWLEKTGRSKGFEGNFATQRGTELEAKARSRYELISMEDMPPATIIHPKYDIVRVSLDGLRSDNKKILEIKCPGESNHKIAQSGKVPDHYVPQVQYQMAATGADTCDFFSYYEGPNGTSDALVEVESNIEYQGMLIAKVLDFWNDFVLKDVSPPLTDRDILEIDDENQSVALLCKEILERKDILSKKDLDALKAEVIQLGGHSKIRCGRVLISVVNRADKFSYHKLTISNLPDQSNEEL